MLGACEAKCREITRLGTVADLTGGSRRAALLEAGLASAAIEGNTLTPEEVRLHARGELRLPGSRAWLVKEIENIADGCRRVAHVVDAGKAVALSPELIAEMNSLVLRDLPLEKGVAPGRIRRSDITVYGYRPPPPGKCRGLLARFCKWVNGKAFEAPEGLGMVYAVIKAVLAHLYLVWIQPFGDGNGRTARLAEFHVLLSAGVPLSAALLLTRHYYCTRRAYYRELDAAGRPGGDVMPFLAYAVEGLRDQLDGLLADLTRRQLAAAWRERVRELFRRKTRPSDVRRLHLALDLSTRRAPVRMSALAEVTPRVAREYARRSSKTLMRDVAALVEMGLLERTAAGICAAIGGPTNIGQREG
jgi:Fic family protein